MLGTCICPDLRKRSRRAGYFPKSTMHVPSICMGTCSFPKALLILDQDSELLVESGCLQVPFPICPLTCMFLTFICMHTCIFHELTLKCWGLSMFPEFDERTCPIICMLVKWTYHRHAYLSPSCNLSSIYYNCSRSTFECDRCRVLFESSSQLQSHESRTCSSF